MINEQALAGHSATADERATAERGLAASREGGFEGSDGVKSFVLPWSEKITTFFLSGRTESVVICSLYGG
jgi:hypothetical protein